MLMGFTVLPSPPPISVFISSPSIPTYDYPYFSLSIIYFFNLLPSFLFFKPLELRHKLHLPTYLTCFLLVFVSLQRLFMLFSSAFHRVFCNFWQGVSFQFFGSRSTLLRQLLQDTHLTTEFSGVPGFHRWSLVPPPPPASRRVATPFDPTASHHFGHWWFPAKPVFPVAERPPLIGACSSRAVTDGSHCCYCLCVYFFVIFLGLFAVSLSPSLPMFLCLGPCDSIHL
jgi:hypothetical protein